MIQRRATSSILAVCLAGGTSSIAPARAAEQAPVATEIGPSDVELAEQYAAEGYEAYRVRDYGRAVTLYERALAAAPSPDIVYNIARVYDLGLLNRRTAIEYYERFLTDSGAASARFETASQRLEELRAAELASREDELVDAIARDFPLDVSEAPPPARAPPTPQAPADVGLRPLELGAIALGGAGLVGVGVGVGFGLSARSRTDAWRRDCDGNVCVSQHAVDAAKSAERRASVATIGFAAGGSLLALGAVVWLIDAEGEESDEAAALRAWPVADGSSVGGSLRGSF
jgi:tetratricopeptide (TPR) repeat protein